MRRKELNKVNDNVLEFNKSGNGGFQRSSNMMLRLAVNLFLGICIWLPVVSYALVQSAPNTIVIKDHQFNPSQLIVPVGQKVQIIVDNQDPTAEEFESFDLDREQVVEGNKKIIVFIGPLKPGTYGYWADYHQDSKGVIIAK